MNKKAFFIKDGCTVYICKKVRVSIFSFAAAIFFTLSQGVLFSLIFFYAILIHELSHVMFLLRFGGSIEKITIYPFGIDILADTHRLSYKKEIVVSLAGSAANLLNTVAGCIIFDFFSCPPLLFFILCHLLLGLFNLIPLSFFDGGRALRLILYDCLEIDTAFYVQRLFDLFSSLFFLTACFALIIYSRLNFSVFVLTIYAAATVFYLCITKRSRQTSAPRCCLLD